jgi:hypothetical protein
MTYSFSGVPDGWQITSSNGLIRKTVTLAPRAWAFNVQYQTFGGLTNQPLFVRHGLSPNLYDLLLHGQRTLGDVNVSGGALTLANTNYSTTVQAIVGLTGTAYNAAATDDNPGAGVNFFTIPMRNQAQTHQVEVYGTNAFSFTLGFRAYPSDWDGDGIPNTTEDMYGLNSTNAADGLVDSDGDGVNNFSEWIANTPSNNSNDYLRAAQHSRTNTGIYVRFPSKSFREYRVYYQNQPLPSQVWQLATSNAIRGVEGTTSWLDDGAATAPHPFSVSNRFYQIRANLPE